MGISKGEVSNDGRVRHRNTARIHPGQRSYFVTVVHVQCHAVFHAEGEVPWDFPPLVPPSSFADSTVYFVLFSHPKWDQVTCLKGNDSV